MDGCQARGLSIWAPGPGREPPSRAARVRPCRHNHSDVEGVTDRRGGTSRTGAKRAGECDGLTGLPEANAGGPGPQATVPTCAGTTRFRAPGCGSSPTGESRKVAAALKADLHRPEPGGRLAGSDRLLRVRHGGQVPPVTTWERFTPSSWTHRPMHRRVISPPTSWEVPPPPTASRLRATSCARITDEPRPLPLSMRP